MTLEERVLDVLKNTFELDVVDTTCSQETCEKWDSMNQLNLIIELETEFDVSFEPEEIAEIRSVFDIEKLLKVKGIE